MTRGRAKVAMSDRPRPAGSVPRPTRISSNEDSLDLRRHQQGGRRTDLLKVFANEHAAERWFAENDPEGVAFAYEVIE